MQLKFNFAIKLNDLLSKNKIKYATNLILVGEIESRSKSEQEQESHKTKAVKKCDLIQICWMKYRMFFMVLWFEV